LGLADPQYNILLALGQGSKRIYGQRQGSGKIFNEESVSKSVPEMKYTSRRFTCNGQRTSGPNCLSSLKFVRRMLGKHCLFVPNRLKMNRNMFVLESDILESAHISEEEVRIELAILLYWKNRLPYAQARALSGLSRIEFDDLLYQAGVPSNYTSEDLHQDLQTLEKLRSRHGDRE